MKYKLLKYSLLSLFVMLCGNVFADYQKVTSTAEITDGEYLIVWEGTQPVAFNGALETLDAVSNTVDVSIVEGVIASTETIDEAVFTIDVANGTIKNASGKYIGVSSNSNGLKQTENADTYKHTFAIDENEHAVISSVFDGSTMTLRFNNASNQNRFRYYKSGQQAIQLYKKTGGQTDTRTATKITLGEAVTTGVAGTSIDLPTATVMAGTTVIANAVVEWTIVNQEIAAIENGKINLLKAGTTDVKANYAGDANYKASSEKFTLTVTRADSDNSGTKENPYTVAQAIEAIDAGAGITEVYAKGIVSKIVTAFNSQFGNISYNISEDGTTTGAQLQAYRGKGIDGADFTSEDDIQVGDEVVIFGNLKKYNTIYEFDANNQLVSLNRTEDTRIATTIALGEYATTGEAGGRMALPTATVKDAGGNAVENAVVEWSSSNEQVATIDDGFISFVKKGTTTITATFPGSVSHKNSSASFKLEVTETEQPETTELQNPYTYTFDKNPFSESVLTAELANATWTLNTDGGYFGFNADKGAQFGSGSKPATKLTLSTTSIPGTISKIVINTSGANSIEGTMSVTVGGTTFDDVITLTSTATDYTFTGSATGEIIISYAQTSSKAIYVKSITIEYAEGSTPEPAAQDITGTWDFANTDVMTATVALSGSNTAGEVDAVEKNGLKMIVEANGASFRNNGNNIQVQTGAVFKVPVKTAGDLVTVAGYPDYSKYTIGNSTEVLTETNTYKAKNSDAEAGYVAVTSMDGNNYYYSLSVTQYAPKENATLDNEAVMAHFTFNEGTEGQTATFSKADYFLSSKVTHGEGLVLEGKDNKNLNQTWFNPVAKDSKAGDGNAINFIITPKPGLTFMPTKVSFKTTRFGTNGGKLDIAWKNADGTLISLASDIQPVRDNASPNVSEPSYDVTGATAAEGACGLQINLYSLDPGKHVGFSEIIIEGTLSGTEQDVPVLASFKINDKEYLVEDVFGEQYEATLKLSKAETMVSAENPLTDVTVSSGEVGTITYEGKETDCKVIIPMTAGTTRMDYVLNIIQKPDYKLSYMAIDGTTVLKEQTVEEDGTIGEFAYDIADVASSKNGYKARGWFKQNYLGAKFTTSDVIKGDTKLYALETEIETPSNSRKYVYDLTDQFFYDEDHEGFNSIGKGKWHDKQHGWEFKSGDQIELLVGPKATINFSLCAYSPASATIEASNGATINAMVDSDGGAGSIDYEGEAGTLTLTLNGGAYIHNITVFNTSETNYAKQGEWIIVKKGDASSLLDAIEVAKGIENTKIFLPEGTYDLGETMKTIISGKNVSLIGQNAEKTIIVNHPPVAMEGLDKADLLKNTGEGLYMQDISLKNDLSYGGNDGRAASLHDTGTKTICKNVFLLSHQDTYYSHKVGGLYYFEGGELHGTVDYLCGNGKVYYNNVKLVNEVRNSATITANSELYVFNNCTVENNAGTYNFGRAWSDNPVCIYLNTTLLDGGNKLANTRWNLNGLNCDYSIAGEYGTKDANGNNITPESNVVTFTKQNTEMNTILSASALDTYSMERVLGEWATTAKESVKQADAPADATITNGVITWTAVEGASAYALFKNGEFVALITDGTTYSISNVTTNDSLTLRSANQRGGFGLAGAVKAEPTGIVNANAADVTNHAIYNMQGIRVEKAKKGLYIINGKKVVVR